ncbi:LOW QUALITY PROTEIN: protein SOSEKI 2 [Juglans microcarpa x Juglans regia]|uniref:LOW QUALITY PROTEIN: protein SOSEKI 2 n=1 Tax=Juglans microcarpa x Juglans regia TaxID=2249226 RepID=UPI001B7DEA6B|nr:LOW QUALITY PROTEIN: protein SOSEKI 2 [Juglans microcarpa x Juglans regia]
MEGRMKKYQRQVSPERAKVWREKSPKYQQYRSVPVVYYLCRNRQLEHPHFMEVPLSSPDGLYLRDVIERLNVLRGRGMASVYSWSCKRSYKNGFVWHDLCEDDLIHPAHGTEYVLKGSELFEDSNSDRFSPIGIIKTQNLRQLPEPSSSRSHEDSSSSSSMNGKETKHSQEDELSPPVQGPGSSSVSPESRAEKNFSWVSLSLTEYKVHKSDGLADASTQTEENVSRPKPRETCTRGVSTDDTSLEPECSEIYRSQISRGKENSEICRESVSPPPSTSSASSSGGKTETLESLIRADASKINSFRILEEEEIRMPTNARLKATNVLMQLISCGSISVKDHSFGLIPTYKPRFSHSKFPSPLFSTSVMLGELDCLTENPRLMGLRLEDKEYFSGSLIETKVLKEEGADVNALKRSSSCNAARTSKQSDSLEEKEESSSGRSKCIPRSIKTSLSKQPRSESMKSPVSERPRNSSDGADSSQIISPCVSNAGSMRITDRNLGRKQSNRLGSFREDEKVIKIDERLASGARVIIESKAPCDTGICSS